MPHKFLFTWEDTYSLQQEVQKRKDAFLQKYGDQAFFSLAGDDIDSSSLLNVILWWGMFATKKLIILRGIPKDSLYPYSSTAWLSKVEDALISHRDQIPEDHVVILTCAKPDKRTKGWKFFQQHADLKEFKALKEKDLRDLVHKQLSNLISIDQASYIVQLVWLSTWNIMHECEKLTLYADYNWIERLTNKQIENVVYHQWEINAFGVLETLFTDKETTIKQIEQLKAQWQDIFQMLWMLYRGLKLLLQMIDCFEHGIKQWKEIASRLSMHPFAVNKQLKKIPELQKKKQSIRWLFFDLVEIDSSIKTWKLPAEWFWSAVKTTVYNA